MPEPGNPQALNRYAYTLNNPLKYTDPSGHWVLLEDDPGEGSRVAQYVRLVEKEHGVDLRPFRGKLDMKRLGALDREFTEKPSSILDFLPRAFDPYGKVDPTVRQQMQQAGDAMYHGERPIEQRFLEAVKGGLDNPVDQARMRSVAGDALPSLTMRIEANARNAAISFFLTTVNSDITQDLGSHPMNYEPNYLAALMVQHKHLIWPARVQYAQWLQHPQNRALEQMDLTGGSD